MFFQSECTSCTMDTVEVVEVCVRHGKKRQVEYLERLPGACEQWVCKAGEQCKMSLKPNKRVKELARLLAEGLLSTEQWAGLMAGLKAETMGYPSAHSPAVAPAPAPAAAIPTTLLPCPSTCPSTCPSSCPGTCPATPCTPTPPEPATPAPLLGTPTSPEDPLETSLDSITSWADEMDKECPLMPEIELNLPSARASNSSPATPSPACRTLFKPEQPRQEGAAVEAPSNAALLARLSSLEQELSQAKRKLAKATGEMTRAVRSEKVMETRFRHLQAELTRMRPGGAGGAEGHPGLRPLNISVSIPEPDLLSPDYDPTSRGSVGPTSSGAWSSADSLRSTPLSSARSTPSNKYLASARSPVTLPGWPPVLLDSAANSRRDSGQAVPFINLNASPVCFPSPILFPQLFVM